MSDKQELFEQLDSFDTAMLVTRERTGDGLMRGRPMTVAGRDEDGTLWFATAINSEKVDEITVDDEIAVMMQSKGRFVSLNGRAYLVRDKEKAHRLWSEKMRPWFPGGARDPSLGLIRLVPHEAEYWDTTGLKGIRYVFDMAKAAVQGDRAPDDTPFGRVAFDRP